MESILGNVMFWSLILGVVALTDQAFGYKYSARAKIKYRLAIIRKS